jgi:hypothetical protein
MYNISRPKRTSFDTSLNPIILQNALNRGYGNLSKDIERGIVRYLPEDLDPKTRDSIIIKREYIMKQTVNNSVTKEFRLSHNTRYARLRYYTNYLNPDKTLWYHWFDKANSNLLFKKLLSEVSKR